MARTLIVPGTVIGMAKATLTLSLTETAQFRRLVEFFGAVEEHADNDDDYVLRGLVQECRDDLLKIGSRD